MGGIALRVGDVVSRTTKAAWYDDQMKEIQAYAGVISGLGLRPDLFHPKDVWSSDFVPPQINLVDLELGDANYDGITVVKKIITMRPDAKIILVSRYFDLQKYEGVGRFVPPGVPLGYFDKADLANLLVKPNNESTRQVVDRAASKVRDEIRLIKSMDQSKFPPNLEPIEAPEFEGLNALTFYDLPREKQGGLALLAYMRFQADLERQYQLHPDAAWMVVGVPTGEIIVWGSDDQRPPTHSSQVIRLGRSALTDCVPIVFRRPRVDD